MKIAHLEAGRHLYGGALQVKYLLQGLSAYPVDNLLVCSEGAAVAETCAPFAQVLPIALHGDLDLGLPKRLARILCEHQVDLLHVHSRRGADVYGALAARRAGVPALVTRRVDNREPGWLARLKYGRGFARVVAISKGVAEVLLGEGVRPDHLEVIPSAVDLQLFRPMPDRAWFEREFDLAPEAIAVGVVAQLIGRKGHSLLFEQLPPLVRDYPQLRVLLFGQGPLEAKLRQQAERLGLKQVVTFCGFRSDLAKVLPNLELLVHPAYQEGLGVALLQASACAVPIVAARAGGIPEAVAEGEHGFLFTPGKGEELAHCLRRLLSDRALRSQFAARGPERMRQHFSVEAMAQSYYRLYQRLLNTPSG